MIYELLLLLSLLFLLGWFLYRQRRLEHKNLKKKISELLSHELKSEIDQERREALSRKEKFEKALRQADGNSTRDQSG
jgi:hypothetical protein